MSRFATAIKAFFRILSDPSFASSVTTQMTTGKAPAAPVAPKPTPAPTPKPAPAPIPAAPVRNDALTLLAALQREARMLDFLMEPINAYSDAQVGAAVRDIHNKSAKLLADYFAITPLLETKEGDPCTIPAGYDPIMYHVTGSIPAAAPFKGTVRHPGWRATQCKLPQWTGKAASALIVSPAEVEC